MKCCCLRYIVAPSVRRCAMSVFKRKSKYGETREYHYKFMQGGKWFYGVCEGCTTERAAIAYEKKLRSTAKTASEQKSVKALIDNFADQLTGGSAVPLADALELYLKKPKKRMPGAKQLAQKISYWGDFTAWMAQSHPEVVNLRDVRRSHAEEYIALLRTSGSFQYVESQRRRMEETKFSSGKAVEFVPQGLSPATINVRHKTVKAVFAWLAADAGIIENPFDIQFLDNQYESREAFTPEELRLIGAHLDDDPFVKPIFLIGICTGLSEGDICNLRWEEIRNGWIVRKRRKTGAALDIPILPPLAAFLAEHHPIENSEFVLPEHAAMYASNPTGVTYRVKQFLERLGIKTSRKAEGRSRSVSSKDVHSLRHTFAYLAGEYRIPLPIVQSVLGHMSPEMTKHYQAHADREAKEKYLTRLPDFLNAAPQQLPPPEEPERQELNELLARLPLDEIRRILAQVRSTLPDKPVE